MTNGPIRANVMTPQQIASRRQTGQALIGQGLQNRGRDALGALAQMAQTAAGAFITGRANEAEAARQQAAQQALMGLFQQPGVVEGARPAAGTPGAMGPQPGVEGLVRRTPTAADLIGAQGQFPELAGTLGPVLAAQLAAQAPKDLMDVAPGASVFDPNTNRHVFTAPEKSDVLSEEAFAQKLDLAVAGKQNQTITVGGQKHQLPPPKQGYEYVLDRDGEPLLEEDPDRPGHFGPVQRVIKGGPADTRVKDASRKEGRQYQARVQLENIGLAKQEIVDNPWWTTGFVGQFSQYLGGTPAMRVRQLLEPIESALASGALQKMREESPTGGALGQASDRDIDLLKRQLVSLEQAQDAETLLRGLDVIEDHYKRILYGSPADFAKVNDIAKLDAIADTLGLMTADARAAYLARYAELDPTILDEVNQ